MTEEMVMDVEMNLDEMGAVAGGMNECLKNFLIGTAAGGSVVIGGATALLTYILKGEPLYDD